MRKQRRLNSRLCALILSFIHLLIVFAISKKPFCLFEGLGEVSLMS